MTAATLLLTLAVGAACDDSDPFVPDDEPDVYSAELTATGATTVTFGRSRQPNGPLTIGNNATVTFEFYDENGQLEPVVHAPGAFRLDVSYPNGNPAGLAFTRSATNLLSGVFTRTTPTAGPMSVSFTLYHIADAHADQTWTVQVNVN
jgi:hypothetical protein